MNVLDKVWMLVLPNNAGVVYEVGASAKEVWEKVIRREVMGTGVSRKQLVKQGYVARKVIVSLREEDPECS